MTEVSRYVGAIADWALNHLNADASAMQQLQKQIDDARANNQWERLAELAQQRHLFPERLTEEMNAISNDFNEILKKHGILEEDVEFPSALLLFLTGESVIHPVAELKEHQEEERLRKFVPNYQAVLVRQLLRRDSSGYVYTDTRSLIQTILTDELKNDEETIRHYKKEGIISAEISHFSRDLIKISEKIQRDDMGSIATHKLQSKRLSEESRELFEYIADRFPRMPVNRFKAQILNRLKNKRQPRERNKE